MKRTCNRHERETIGTCDSSLKSQILGMVLLFGDDTSSFVAILILGILVSLHQRNHAELYESVT